MPNNNKSDWPTRPIKVDDQTWQNGEMVARVLGCNWGERGNVSEVIRLLLGMTEGEARLIKEIIRRKILKD